MRHTVEAIHTENGQTTGVTIRNQKTGETWTEPADHVVANVTVQNLMQLLGDQAPNGYQRRVEKLPPSSGAFVVYLGVDDRAIPEDCPPHLQFLYDYEGAIGENNSLFVSVSRPGDGRAPAGKATIIASSFTDIRLWWGEGEAEGRRQKAELKTQNSTLKTQNSPASLKQRYTDEAIARLSQFFNLNDETILHVEAATPRTFAHFTGRDRGTCRAALVNECQRLDRLGSQTGHPFVTFGW
jgi:phytoene dehydrogenase-like protein